VAGQSANGTLTLNAVTTGAATLKATVSGSYVDPTSANDAAERSISVISATPEVPATQGRKGGGGSVDWLAIAALCSLFGLRRRALPHKQG
jgi:hypothetical protein